MEACQIDLKNQSTLLEYVIVYWNSDQSIRHSTWVYLFNSHMIYLFFDKQFPHDVLVNEPSP